MITRVLLLALAFLAMPIHAHAAPTSNAAIDWAQIVQPSIHSATAPRSGGSAEVLHTMVMLAMYDAVVAIEGGYRPYAAAIPAWRRGDVRAAAATAAYLTARARVAASQVAYLDQEYAAYLGSIPDGAPKREGVRVGTAAAEAMLALRADDGFDNTIPYACSATAPEPGEFEPDTGCPTHPGASQVVDRHRATIRRTWKPSPGRRYDRVLPDRVGAIQERVWL